MPPLSTFLFPARPIRIYKQTHADSLLARANFGPTNGVHFSQLGNNSTTQSNAPVQVKGMGGTGLLSGIVSIAAGTYYTCAVSATGAVYCWGQNNSGQLGNNSTTQSNVPVQVKGVGGTGLLSGIVSIAAGDYHTCALSTTGALYCWGWNPYGQLGNNSTMSSYVPVQVTGL